MIRPVTSNDAEKIADIYNYYIENTVVTFETELIDKNEIVRRVEDKTKTHPWIVFEENWNLLGYAYAGKWHVREAYSRTCEISIYLDQNARGKGVGSKLMEALLVELKNIGIHVAIGCIALPNEASVKIHEKFGFDKISHFREVGWKFDKWVDVGHWELIL